MDVESIIDAYRNNDVSKIEGEFDNVELKQFPIMGAFGAFDELDQKLFIDLCDWLFDNGLDVNATENNGNTGLIVACMKKKKEYVDLYLRHGADLECKASNGATPIIIALNGEVNSEIVESLVKAGANLNEIVTINGVETSTLEQACLNCDSYMLKNLIYNGASIEKQKRLLNEIEWDDTEEDREKQKILKEFENKKYLTPEDETVIIQELNNKLIEIVKQYILEYIRNLEPAEGKRRANNQEALMMFQAIFKGDVDALTELLEDDIDINTAILVDPRNQIINVAYGVLMCKDNSIKILDTLVKYGYKFNIINPSTGVTLLLSAILLRVDEDLVAAIINHGAEVNVRNTFGNSPLGDIRRFLNMSDDDVNDLLKIYKDVAQNVNIEINETEFSNKLGDSSYGKKNNIEKMLVDRGAVEKVEDKYFSKMEKIIESYREIYIMPEISISNYVESLVSSILVNQFKGEKNE